MEPIIKEANGKTPKIHASAFVAPTAVVLGDVEIGPEASIWFHCVIDGRKGNVTVGARSNVQDGSHVRVVRDGTKVVIGEDVLVGHSAVLIAEEQDCIVEDEGFIGIKSVVASAIVRSKSIVAACANVVSGSDVTSGEMWGGAPAHKLRDLRPGEEAWARGGSAHYVHESDVHRQALAKHGTVSG